MGDSQNPYERFIEIERQKQPQLRELKLHFIKAIVWGVGIFTGLSLVNVVPINRLQPFALAFGFMIFFLFLLLAAWRIWEFVRFEL